MPPRNVVPKPVQKPHPPLWVACSRRDTILLAAEKGIGALTFAFIDPEEATQWVDDYYSTIAAEGASRSGDGQPERGVRDDVHVSRATRAEAIARGLEGANFFGYSLAHYYVFGDHKPGVTNVWEEYQQRRDDDGLLTPSVEAAVEQDRLGAKVAQAARRQVCAARSARPTRSASSSAATKRPVSTR